MDFGERMRSAREKCGLTQAQLAGKLNIKDARTIRKYESGETEPSFDRLVTIAKTLSVSLDYLFGLSEHDRPDDEKALLQAYYALPEKKRKDAVKLLKALK